MRGAYSSKIDDVQPLTKDSFTLVPFALTLFRFPSVLQEIPDCAQIIAKFWKCLSGRCTSSPAAV